MVLAGFALLVLLVHHTRVGVFVATVPMVRALGVGLVGYLVLVIVTIGVVTKGLINVQPGGWIALVGAVALALGGWAMTSRKSRDILTAHTPGWFDIVVIVVILAAALFGAAFALAQDEGSAFVLFLVFAATLAVALSKGMIFYWLGLVSQRHRQVITLGAFAVAFLFPFTQDGSDVNMSIASQVLIFAATALGLNIVVGLAGLLDLGYIAFLGAGAYVGAAMSQSVFATTWRSSPWPSVRSSGWRCSTSTATTAPTSPTAPTASRRSPTSTSGASTSVSHTRCSASPWGGSPTTTCCCWSSRRSSSSSSPGSTTHASAAAGWRSARTRRPPRRWASTSSG
jgi:hypothetical protein